MKNYSLLLSLILLSFFTTSCTVLQWRSTDKEIHEKFSTLNIKSEISYFKVDSLNFDSRTLSVSSDNHKINLVFLHGSPSSLSAWESYLIDNKLTAIVNMHAIDRPGYGYSNFGKEITSINTQAEITNAIINNKKLKNVIVIGASYGGPIAARVAFLNKNVKAAVMVSPAIDPEIEKDIWASRFTQWKLTRWMVPTAYRVAGDEKKVHAHELTLINKDWQKIKKPIIHIHGNADDLVPYENINFSKQVFDDLKVVTIPEKGHEISWKHKELIIPHLLSLITRIENN